MVPQMGFYYILLIEISIDPDNSPTITDKNVTLTVTFLFLSFVVSFLCFCLDHIIPRSITYRGMKVTKFLTC